MNRRSRAARILFQEVGETVESNEVEENTSTDVANNYGVIRKGAFSITVKSDEKGEDGKQKVLYTNDKEAFDYQVCDSISSCLSHAGAKLTDDQIKFVGEALTSEDAETDKGIGEAIASIVRIYNAKLKSDAKSSRYQSLVNKYKPLEGEKLETAQARTINNIVKMSGLPVESVIEMLKTNKAIPQDYTIADYNSTPLRRTKDESDSE